MSWWDDFWDEQKEVNDARLESERQQEQSDNRAAAQYAWNNPRKANWFEKATGLGKKRTGFGRAQEDYRQNLRFKREQARIDAQDRPGGAASYQDPTAGVGLAGAASDAKEDPNKMSEADKTAAPGLKRRKSSIRRRAASLFNLGAS